MHFESFRRFNTLFLEILPLALRSLATPTSLVGLAVFLRPCNPPPPLQEIHSLEIKLRSGRRIFYSTKGNVLFTSSQKEHFNNVFKCRR